MAFSGAFAIFASPASGEPPLTRLMGIEAECWRNPRRGLLAATTSPGCS
jgi:hypothetical protein